MSDSKFDGWIDVSDPESVYRWSTVLHIDERTLRVAVVEAGNAISDVLAYLNNSSSSAQGGAAR